MANQKEFVGTGKQVKPRRSAPTFRQLLDEVAVIRSLRSGYKTPLEIAEDTGLSETRIRKAAGRLRGIVYYAGVEYCSNGKKPRKRSEIFALAENLWDK